MNPKNLTSFSDISFIFSVLYKLPPAVLCKTPTSRRPDYLRFRKHRQPRTVPRQALILGSLAKGSWLAASLAFVKHVHTLRHLQCPNLANLICRKTEGSPASNLSASAITSANNPSVTAPKNSVLYQYIFNLILKAIPKTLYHTVTAPFTQGS